MQKSVSRRAADPHTSVWIVVSMLAMIVLPAAIALNTVRTPGELKIEGSKVALVLAQYDAEVRANPKAPPGLVVERADSVVCLTGYFNFISWWELTPGTVRQAVAGHAARFRSRREKSMWRVYEHDSPAEISRCLAEEGFEPDATGTLMIFDLAMRCRHRPRAIWISAGSRQRNNWKTL
jgi:hypothetical protein